MCVFFYTQLKTAEIKKKKEMHVLYIHVETMTCFQRVAGNDTKPAEIKVTHFTPLVHMFAQECLQPLGLKFCILQLSNIYS